MRAPKTTTTRAMPCDGDVLARVAAGDMGALGELYDRYAAALLRFARRLDAREAEDIVQQVFLRVVRLAATFDREVASARPWLYAITAHVAQERRRALRRWTHALMRMADQPRNSTSNLLDTRQDLERGLAGLTVQKRTVLVLAEVEGFACEEIAAMLAIPIGTVWTRLHHARRELRRHHQEVRR